MLLFLIASLLPTVLPLLLNRTITQAVALELGVTYTRNISTLFNDFQYSSLRQFRNKDSQVPSKTCYVAVQQ